jgi:MarR family transcriptional regulator, lower aerobic nicotinate degradation pathway regulator
MGKQTNISIQLMQDLLPLIDAYSQSNNAKPTLASFNQWLMQDYFNKAENAKKITKAQTNKKFLSIDGKIASGIGLLNRFAKQYAKSVFENSTIQSLDEFTYLATLMHVPSMSKSELIDEMVQEKTTGSEIIKRLLNNRLISETISPNDKRIKLVSITAKGMQQLQQLFPLMEVVSVKVVANLSSAEKKQLNGLIEKLEKTHRELQTSH